VTTDEAVAILLLGSPLGRSEVRIWLPSVSSGLFEGCFWFGLSGSCGSA
jgi:hypothetical protein